MSTSKNPDSASTSSPAVRSTIEFRSRRPGLVAAFPQIGSRYFTGAKYRSIVAADIATSSARAPALILTLARYQCAFGFHRVEPVGHRRCKVLSATTA